MKKFCLVFATIALAWPASLLANIPGGGIDGGQMYWKNTGNQGLTFTYSVVVDPASNGGSYGEIVLTTTIISNIVIEVHYSMLRGNSGFYATPISHHRVINGAFTWGESHNNVYAGSIFNWMSVDTPRNRLVEVSRGGSGTVDSGPKEVYLLMNGIYAGRYAPIGILQNSWHWSQFQ